MALQGEGGGGFPVRNGPKRVAEAALSPAAAAKAPKLDYAPYRPEMASTIVHYLYDNASDDVKRGLVAQCGADYHAANPKLPPKMKTDYLTTSTLGRLLGRGEVEDAPRSGRPQKASDKDVQQFMSLFLLGNGKDGDEWWGFTSIQHALAESEALRDLLTRSQIKAPRMMQRIMAAHMETFGKPMTPITILLKPKLEDRVKTQRLECAVRWVNGGIEKLMDTVWIDEKQQYLRPGGSYRCYGAPGVRSFQRACQIKLGKSERIKYCAAVSAFGGATYFTFVSGTTGRKQPFLVRTCVPVRRHLDPAAGTAMLPSLV